MATNPSDPAFLTIETYPSGSKAISSGLTKREYFAGLIIAAMWSRDSYDEGLRKPSQRAHIACIDADALIIELNKGAKE